MKKESDELYYFFRRLSQSKKENSAGTEFVVTKNQLINPYLKECFKKGYFSDISKKGNIVIRCSDPDLFFNEEEYKVLKSNYNAIKNKCELSFIETIAGVIDEYHQDGRLIKLNIVTKKVNRTLEEIEEINQKLSEIADNINKGFMDKNGVIHYLSPLEKYCFAFKAVSNIEYYIEENNVENSPLSSQSFIDTVKQNKGCCLGKAQYLKALLSMIGVNNCPIAVNDELENLFYISYLSSSKELSQKFVFYNDTIMTIAEFREILAKKISKETDLNKLMPNHAINLVYLDDQKYGVNGVFACDATNDFSFIPINMDNRSLFHFMSYYESGEDISNFLKNVKLDEKTTAKDEAKIEKEYFQFAKEMIIIDLCGYFPNTDEDFSSDKEKFIRAIRACNSTFEIKSLFDDKRFEKNYFTGKTNKYYEQYEEVFEKFFDNENDHLLRLITAVDARIKLENAPLVSGKMASDKIFETFEIINNKINKISRGEHELSL